LLAASVATSHRITSPAGLRAAPGNVTMFSTAGSRSSVSRTSAEQRLGATIRRCTIAPEP
jgi:hypothetical protein